MTKKQLITTLLCLFATVGLAQKTTFKPELALGVSFGTNFSNISFAPYTVNTKMKMGYNGGLTIRWNTEKNLGLQAEINYTQYGWEEKFDDPQYKYSRTINYIDLPILTHIYFGSKHFKVIFNIGPKIGYALSESTDSNLNGAKPNNDNTQHDMAVEKKFDWGLCGGPGIELHTGIGSLILEGRYYYALGDIFNSRKQDHFSRSSSQVLSAKVTYVFPIRK